MKLHRLKVERTKRYMLSRPYVDSVTTISLYSCNIHPLKSFICEIYYVYMGDAGIYLNKPGSPCTFYIMEDSHLFSRFYEITKEKASEYTKCKHCGNNLLSVEQIKLMQTYGKLAGIDGIMGYMESLDFEVLY